MLLVDDSALVTGALRVLLEETGHRVTTADSVASATAAALAEVPDVLLLDLTLPDGNGLEVLDRLRAEDRLPRTVVALTGHDDEALAAHCRSAGCREVVVKPVSVRVLIAKMREWVGEEAS
ncbi:MAG TPA: response regulator [Gemmatimonadaceae bacterium]